MNYTVRDMETARLAGFFDGEGSICICKCTKFNGNRQCSPVYNLSVEAFQLTKNAHVLHDLVNLFGGKVVLSDRKATDHFGAQSMSRWEVGQHGAVKALLEMFPYLRVKHRQAFIAIVFGGHKQAMKAARRGKLSNTRLAPDDLKVRDALYRMCRYFNSKKTVAQGVAPA